ncbi:MAG: hypothetical protein ABI405_00465 [Parafilimonas sp.]
MRHLTMVFLFAISFCVISFAQIPLDKLKNVGIKNLPDVNKILLGEEPITTNLNDAVYEAPELDDFIPANILPASELPRDNNGSFYLFPGVWEFHLKSYCLRAGTYPPSDNGSSGYIYAPLKGPKADIISSILSNGFKHPEIKQQDIQVLIWAIIDRANFKDMQPEYMIIAKKLLNDQQLLQLNKDVLKNYGQAQFSKLCESLPAPVQQVLEAENEMRGLLSKPGTKYEDLEKVALLTGIEPEDEGRKVTKGRWSLTPEGFYIRYFPYGYAKMVLQVYVKDDMYNAFNYIEIKNITAKGGGPLTELEIPLRFVPPPINPGKFPGVPGGRKQRLAPSNDKNPDNRNDALDKANKVLSGSKKVIGASRILKTNPIGNNLFGRILDFITETGRKISNALNGDPPDPDYANFAMAEHFDYKDLHENAFEDVGLNQLATDFADSYLEAYGLMLALSKSNDKLGGAKLADDKLWMEKQAQSIIFYKKAVGDALLIACEKWKVFFDTYNKGVKTPFTFTPDDVSAYHDKLRTTGFDESELAAFKFLKMSEGDINNLKNQRLTYDYSNYSTNYLDNPNLIMNAWKEYGNVYSKFPVIPAPW